LYQPSSRVQYNAYYAAAFPAWSGSVPGGAMAGTVRIVRPAAAALSPHPTAFSNLSIRK
jgi:hypothetical protein